MPRLLVVGGSGLLGQHVAREGLAQGSVVYSTYHSRARAVPGARPVPCDLTDGASLQRAFQRARPDSVVLCAALTGVDFCEDHPTVAAEANARGPARVADLCVEWGARLALISTDYVFDGTADPYDEGAEPNPLSVYGRTKREGELEVLQRLPSATVVRLSALYGWNRLQEKPNSVTWILDRLRRRQEVPLFTDQWVSPSYAADAAPLLLRLLESSEEGVFHLAPPDCVTRLELGELVCEVFSLPRELLRPSTLAEAKLRAPRPRRSCLVSRRLEKATNTRVRSLRPALEHMREME